MSRELEARELRWTCPLEWIPEGGTASVEPADGIVGQDRAVEAIAFGLEVPGVGFNVFVTGLSGTGRLTTIKQFLDRLAEDGPVPRDVCFVQNFDRPEEPRALQLEAGAGRRLRDGVARMVEELRETVPSLLAAKEFRERVELAVANLRRQERDIIGAFEAQVEKAGFRLVQIQTGETVHPDVLPVVEDEPVPLEQLEVLVGEGKIPPEEAKRLQEGYEKLSERLQEVFEAVGRLREKMQEQVEQVRLALVRPILARSVAQVRKQVGDPAADEYLEALRKDIEENLDLLGEDEEIVRWQVNLAVDNAQTRGRPVVLETEPTYTNLFGAVERRLLPSGEARTDFTRIRAGSLLRANGGFLVLNADDALAEPRVWPALKRALKYRRVQIQSMESLVLGASTLKPEAVPLDLKVVVIGDRGVYDLLYRYDKDFSKIFKILADFDSVLPADQEGAGNVVAVLAKVIREEGLLDLDREGLAAMLEVAVRQARWRRRLSSRFSDLADILREASHRARSAGASRIGKEHVQTTVRAQLRRHGLTEERMLDSYREGLYLVRTRGEAVGQVNGLAVYDLGHHAFGRPMRITAQVGLGREGVINVERRAGLSGPTHDKGVQILTGFLRGTFARRVPLSIACSVTFEQSYGGIDGDSASSTEVYAILSALSDLPVRQDIAVTGSVDQYGNVQPIGGVNEKIEGFFKVCREEGLTGTQGVMIPATNVGDLHLDPQVVEAVEAGQFHVWAVERIEEGIELLTGVPAGEWTGDGGWTPDSVYARCQERLDEMVRQLKNAGKESRNEAGEPGDSGEGEEQEKRPGT